MSDPYFFQALYLLNVKKVSGDTRRNFFLLKKEIKLTYFSDLSRVLLIKQFN